jgi:hypothetical protein
MGWVFVAEIESAPFGCSILMEWTGEGDPPRP